MGSSAFEKLFTTSVPHILEKIFFSLDYESYKACHEVCKDWNELLSTESFKRKANTMLTENGEKLRRAIREESLDEIFRILSKGMVDVNCDLVSFPWTLFHYALFKGNKEMVKLLLKARADINKRNQYGKTPLCWAIHIGQIDMVQILLDNRADPNKADNDGVTPLLFAAKRGNTNNTAVVKLLIERGADVDQASDSGDTPLQTAASSGLSEIVKVLLDGGADPDKPDNRGTTPLHLACHLGVVKLLIERGAEVDKANNYGRTPLHKAARLGRKEIVKALLEGGADPSKKDEHGGTPYARYWGPP